MRTDTERLLANLDQLKPSQLRGEIERRTGAGPDRPVPDLPGTSRRLAAAVLAIAVFVTAAGFAWSLYEHYHSTVPMAPTDPWIWAHEGWTELPPPPQWRDGAGLVWTGSELLYWGGTPRGDAGAQPDPGGYAFDPVVRAWRALPEAPAAATGTQGVWTGSEALFWGGRGMWQQTNVATATFDTVLAYQPATGTWRRLPASPHEASFGGAWAWTGNELIVWGGDRPNDPAAVQGAALDPTVGTWRVISDSPAPMTLANAAWTGSEVVVVGAALREGNHSTTPTAVALAYDPAADAWRRLPDPPLSPQASETVLFDGDVIAWDYGGDSARLVLGQDGWQSMGRLPLDHFECYVQGASLADVVLTWDCGYPDAWYPDVGWVDIEGGPAPDVPVDRIVGSQGTVIGAGSVAVLEQIENVLVDGEVHIGLPDAPMHLWVWRPPVTPPATRRSSI